MEIPYKTGMIFKSKTHPQFDLIIDYVNYAFDDNGKINKYGTFICWCNINKMEFEKFTDKKLGSNRKSGSTFPYAFFGEGQPNSIKQRIKNYNLEYVGMSNDEIKVYMDNEYEYSSGFKNMNSELSK